MDKLFEDYFDVKECEFTFKSVLDDKNLSQERASELKNYNMLFLPIKNYRNTEGFFFYNATRDFYLYCKNESPDNHFEYCTEKTDYKEISLNSSELYLGPLIVKNIVLPIFLNLISNYIFYKLTDKDDKVILNIIIQNEETNKSDEISFKGTKKDFGEKVINTLQTYTKEGKIKMPEQKGVSINVLS